MRASERAMGFFQKIKQRGFFNLLARVCQIIVPESFLRFSVWEIFELDVNSATATQMSENVLIENVSNDQAKRKLLQQLTWNSVELAELEKHHGYLTRLSEQSASESGVGGLWVATGQYPETALGFRMIFQPRQAWIYAAYVNQAIRGKSIYQRTLAFACEDLDRQGWEEILVAVAPWNKASMYVHKKHSKQKVGRVVAVRFLKFAAIFHFGNIMKSKTFTSDYIERPIQITTQSTQPLPPQSIDVPAI